MDDGEAYRMKMMAHRNTDANAYIRLECVLKHIRRGDVVKAERSIIRVMNRHVRDVKQIEDELQIEPDHRYTAID